MGDEGEKVARAQELWDALNYECGDRLDLDDLETIVKAMRQVERETWEKAAKLIEDGVDVPFECGPGNWKTFKSSDVKTMAKTMRQQAKERA